MCSEEMCLQPTEPLFPTPLQFLGGWQAPPLYLMQTCSWLYGLWVYVCGGGGGTKLYCGQIPLRPLPWRFALLRGLRQLMEPLW